MKLYKTIARVTKKTRHVFNEREREMAKGKGEAKGNENDVRIDGGDGRILLTERR